MFISLVVLSAAELLIYAVPIWELRSFTAPLIAVALGVLGGAWFMQDINGWSFIALLILIYRCFNLIRVASGISTPQYLKRSGLKSSALLATYYGVAQLGWFGVVHRHVTGYQAWLIIAGMQLVGAVIVLLVTRHNVRHMVPVLESKSFADRDLPSITVAIPARNETDVLQDALIALLASDYPKLEILVLDDCSQDRTSEVIKDFAQQGVRFVKGDIPPDGWLAKNWAYEQLYKESNGELLVYCGVDVRFDRSTLRTLVATMITRKKRMLCVMPENSKPTSSAWAAVLLQPMRYVWEVSLPRRLFKRPPVLSTCWAVERSLVKSCGSFAAVRSTTSPESHFAREAAQEGAYSFVRSIAALKVTATKSFRAQYDTAVRTRYPQLHRRPELVFLLCLLELLAIIASLPLAVAGLSTAHWLLGLVSGLAFVIYSYVFKTIVGITYSQHIGPAWFSLIPAVLTDMVLRNYSMYRYEFTEVLWKGRNICLPVMQAIPRLPKL